MRIVFDGVVLMEGKRVRTLDIEEGERVWCLLAEDGGLWTEVSLLNGEVICPDCEVERWDGCAVVRPRGDGAVRRAIRQAREEMSGVTYTVTAVCEPTCTNVWIDGLNSRLMVLPRGEDAEVRIVNELSAAAVAVKRGEKRYLMLTALYEDDVLYEGWADEYAIDDRLTVKCTYADMKRHTRQGVYGYIDGKFGLIEQSFTCASAHTFIPMLVPYLFAEALAVGDDEEAIGYLTDDLKEDYSALKAYIGTVSYVRRPPIPAENTDVGIVDASGRGKVLTCEMADAYITDVRVTGEKD